ncbi:hypothetical protein TWF481_004335 [Arthrobotrys musiformis]|uniref:FAD-binding FR-type domain-containing protein n=1 Tax=Arthrobotrys musiformis TaxID=47236 RepID=A0AAV9WJP6_9PEZI
MDSLFPWHIKPHPKEAKELRRAILDFYGILNLSVTLVFIPLLVCWFGRLHRRNLSSSDKLSRWVYLSHWSLSRPFLPSLPRVGSRKSWLFGTIWVVYITFMTISTTGDDYFHLTKRTAHIATSLFPIQYLLSSRFLLQHLSLLTHQTHETLNKPHRWIGRTVYVLLSLHGVLYTFYFLTTERGYRLLHWDVVFGLMGLIIMNSIFVTSLAKYRDVAYRSFLGVHQLLSILVLPVAWFHVVDTRRYVLLAGGVYVLDRVGRYYSTTSSKARITSVSSTAIDLRTTDATDNKKIYAGSHYYISIPNNPHSRGNPFTLSSSENGMKFLIRTKANFTRSLKDLAADTTTVTLEGPYGIASCFPGFQFFDSFVFITGGIGITMTFSVLKDLVAHVEEMSRGGVDVKFVWAVGGVDDAAWPLGELSAATAVGCSLDVDIYISHHGGEERVSMELDDLVEEDSHSLLPTHNDGNNNVTKDMRSLEKQIESLKYRYARTPISPRIQTGRPDLVRVVEGVCKEWGGGRKVAVFVCGPEGMGRDVRRALGGYHREGTVWVWEERF